jgi:2-oxoacid:acceptor oxidoreductase delta subunit (pyruvate/2-ketoisovalerate family)
MTRKRIRPAADPDDELYEVDTGDWKFEEPVVDPDSCAECGRCYVYCPTKAVTIGTDQYEITREWCKGCGICVRVCPTEAIAMREVSDKAVQTEFDAASEALDHNDS